MVLRRTTKPFKEPWFFWFYSTLALGWAENVCWRFCSSRSLWTKRSSCCCFCSRSWFCSTSNFSTWKQTWHVVLFNGMTTKWYANDLSHTHTHTHLVVVGGLRELLLPGCLGDRLAVCAFTLLQVRGQAGVLHLHHTGLGLDLCHLRRRRRRRKKKKKKLLTSLPTYLYTYLYI